MAPQLTHEQQVERLLRRTARWTRVVAVLAIFWSVMAMWIYVEINAAFSAVQQGISEWTGELDSASQGSEIDFDDLFE